jgi:tetratricopeptide (TPR) repeat protein
MATLALNLIMKDEALVLPRLLESVYPLIDRYVVVDTGSRDDSKGVVRDFFADKGIPGDIHDHPFVDFSDARNFALSKLRGVADYGFFIDCDEQLLSPTGGSVEALKMQLGAEDLYTCNMQAEGLIYRRACVFRTDKPFRWIGAVHEALVCDEPISVGHLSGLSVQAHSDGRSWSQGSRGKYLRHAEILLSAVERDGLPRDIFYLAQSYRDAGDYEAALHWYRKRALIPEGYLEERYYAQFMAGALGEQLGHPVQDVLFDYLKASEFDVLRAEHLLNAMLLLQKAGLWQAAHSLGADAVARFHGKAPLASRALFIDESTYAWKLQRVHQATLDALAGQVQGTASVV